MSIMGRGSMMKVNTVSLLALLTLIGWACHATAQPITILTAGDSITAGLKRNGSGNYWFCPANGLVTSSFQSCNGFGKLNVGGYQPDVRQKLSSIGVSANVYNWGVAGDESWNTVNQANQAMNSRAAQVIFIMTGVNDLNDVVSVATTVQNVQAIVDNALARGVRPIVGTVTPHRAGVNYDAKIRLINQGIKAMAESRNVQVADHYSEMNLNWPVYHSGDGLHISDAGDDLMASLWVEAYQKSTVSVAPVLQLLLFDD